MQMTNSTEMSPSEANSHSASQNIPRILRNLKFHYHIQKNLPLISIPSKMHSVHISSAYFPKIHS